jgi:acyl phosphate:glycerol-3-phosphate acyltransferase
MNKTLAFTTLVAYLLGSVPFGYLLVRIFQGADIRSSGSGNIGATNVARSSPALGLVTLVLDAAKGFSAVALATALNGAASGLQARYSAIALAALMAVVGHMFPVWLRFRGGKGVATGVGAFVAIVPKAILLAFFVFATVLALFRYVSFASVVAASVLPAAIFVMYVRPDWNMVAILASSVIVCLLIVVKHSGNMARLLAGTEPRFSFRRG